MERIEASSSIPERAQHNELGNRVCCSLGGCALLASITIETDDRDGDEHVATVRERASKLRKDAAERKKRSVKTLVAKGDRRPKPRPLASADS